MNKEQSMPVPLKAGKGFGVLIFDTTMKIETPMFDFHGIMQV